MRKYNLVNHNKWKKWHKYPPRPIAEKPGILTQIDTIHIGEPNERLYVYTLLDVCSRWSYALPDLKINTHKSLGFVKSARDIASFDFQTVQSDHGSEFSKWFTKKITPNIKSVALPRKIWGLCSLCSCGIKYFFSQFKTFIYDKTIT